MEENVKRQFSWNFDIFFNKNDLPQCLVVFSIVLLLFSVIRSLINELSLLEFSLLRKSKGWTLHSGLTPAQSETKNTGSPSSRCEELLFFLKKSLCGTFSSWNELSWHSYRCHLLLHNDLTRNVTLAFQHVEVLCYNSLNLQRMVWGKTLKGILAEILIFFQQKMTYLNALLSFLFSPRFSARSDGGHIRSPSGLPG